MFCLCGAHTAAVYNGLCAPVEGPVTIFQIPCRGLAVKTAQTAVRVKPRFITTQDLREVPQNGVVQIRAGDVLTALAKDHIEKFGIRIVKE